MANFNQTPSGQPSIDLVLPSLNFVASSNGTWNQPNYAWGGGSTAALTGPGSTSLFIALARALGFATAVSRSGNSGMFTFTEQIAAKRLGEWP